MLLKQEIIEKLEGIISESRDRAARSVDTERVLMYWKIGWVIFEEEQKGADKAAYGSFLITSISERMSPVFGSGFAKRQLERCRQFYRVYPIASALRTQFSWTHYKTLMSLDNDDKRSFYEAEAEKNKWSARQLERQVNSGLFERLLVSNDLRSVLEVARASKQPDHPKEILKDPMVLEFLGLEQKASYYEKDFESAIISRMADFLLELGNGFSFVARQKRIHLDGDDFFVDLVFYNRLLRCFVLIEIKTDKIKHQDIGQLQMYVNYFDRHERQDYENPTVGLLLCADKNDAVVKVTLPEDNRQIFASKYQLYMPSEKQLIEELKAQIKKIDGGDKS